MAVPRDVARSLRRSATKLAQVPNAVVVDLAETTIDEAGRAGGRFFGGRARLIAEVVERRTARGTSTVTVWGKPAGAWAIKSHGRRGGYRIAPRRRRLGRRGAGVIRVGTLGYAAHVTAGPARGDRRWERVVDRVADRAGDDLVDAVRQAVNTRD